jgi:hypothetical protein
MYEEIKADRRSAEDTRNMHQGILGNLRRPTTTAGGTPPAVPAGGREP